MKDLLFILMYFLLPLGATVIIESIVAFILRFDKEEQHCLLMLNIITNPAVSALQLVCVYNNIAGPVTLAIMELAVFAVEGWVLSRRYGRKYWLYALLINAASCGLGLLI